MTAAYVQIAAVWCVYVLDLHVLPTFLCGRGLIEALKHRIVASQRDAVSNDIVMVLKEMLQGINTDKSLKQVQQ